MGSQSCRGIRVESAEVTPSGLRYDREFMLVEKESHRFLTARTIPKVSLLAGRSSGEARERARPVFDELTRFTTDDPHPNGRRI